MSKALVIEYGEYYNYCPCRKLGLAVLERTLLDTIIRDPLKQHIKKAAFIDIYEPPNEDIFSFFWWIAAIFPDPVGTLSAIQDAVHSGAVEKIILQNGRC